MGDLGILFLLITALNMLSAYYNQRSHDVIMERIDELEISLRRAMKEKS